MLQSFHWATNLRTLSFSLVTVCFFAWFLVMILPGSHFTLDYHTFADPSPVYSINTTCVKPEPSARLSQSLFPIADSLKTDSYVGENHKTLRNLFSCVEMSSCSPNQKKVVILVSRHFITELWGWNGGEEIWARSVVKALQTLGYTFVYAYTMDRAVQIYQMFPDMVKAILVEGLDSYACWDDDENCLLSERNPDGIPAWKIFAFHFWTGPDNPLGRNWTVSPEQYALEGYPPNIYIGYSVEQSCMAQAFIPHSDREDQAYVMTKWLKFLDTKEDMPWPAHFYESAANATGIKFIMGANGEGNGKDPDIPPGLKNHGLMNQKAFVNAVAHSKLLVGVGMPVTSPTPYEALCLGVPFINPVNRWDHENPSDRTKWDTQHGMLKLLDPPYVYNVFKDDLDGFIAAIKNALANPIDRHVLDRMRISAVTDRVHDFLEADWKGEAMKLREQWEESGEGPLFVI